MPKFGCIKPVGDCEDIELDSDEEDDVEDDICEDERAYSNINEIGFMYPICIGDVIETRTQGDGQVQEQYSIVHRLGHGASSIVWLAHETKHRKTVALKIMSAGDSNGSREHDYHVQKAIKGSSTKWIRNNQKANAERVIPIDFPPQSVGDSIFLADFGLALKVGASVTKKTQGVLPFISPERFHDYDPSPASDIWSFMVVFFYLYTGCLPFIIPPSGYGASCLDTMVKCLGPLPKSWAERKAKVYELSWYGPSKEFPLKGRDFKSSTVEMIESEALQLRNGGKKDAEMVEKEIKFRMGVNKHAVEVINKVFRFLPEERPTASQLLEDYHFKELMRKCGVA
ncbi:hypothetical protein VMCG_10774 [Cytospora schulzeri]|uniref:Protein kinase domain-containing protein n=1 Tax=Cytospora schulzeri TaxID=448051 RepID=A0A423V809_9PEZI|nr:hypothetical protein VMCG_10774 [Valsa malicola]